MRYLLTLMLLTFTSLAHAETPAEMPEGFQSLFNGKDLKGWVGGTTANPAKIAEAKQEQMDRQVPEHWSVDGDELVSDGHGPHLVTEKKYGNFEMWVDWNLAPKGDSGIYLRDIPQVQIWDPENKAAHRHGSDKGSGGLWNNKSNERWPLEKADKPCGEWNRMYVRMVGSYVKVVLNDKVVVDNVLLENFFDRSKPAPEEGRIHLQTHGSETRFRNIWVRELGDKESTKLIAEITAQD